jgi:hypothetical protein
MSILPGFTADQSVYQSQNQYRAGAVQAATAGIRPQLRRWPAEDCIPGCICVSPFDCPCCDSLPWPLPWPLPTE